MNLLICTQKVDRNDDILGFFHGWVEEFAKHYEKVQVICLWEGEHNLPENVSVHSLGKESGGNRFTYAWRFIRYIVRFRRQYDAVFVHMNPEYVVLGGTLWRLWGKRIGLWYTHKSINLKLCIAARFAHVIFTASASSFQWEHKKLHVLGHGINLEYFVCPKRRATLSKEPSIILVGRFSPIKGQKTAVEAARILRDRGINCSLRFIGTTGDSVESKTYKQEVHALAERYQLSELVSFPGSIPNHSIPAEYCSADIALNLTPRGGLDKAVIEAMASGVVPVTSNDGFREHLQPYDDVLVVPENDPNALADCIESLCNRDDVESVRKALLKEAQERFGVSTLIPKITELL